MRIAGVGIKCALASALAGSELVARAAEHLHVRLRELVRREFGEPNAGLRA
jgi:hypothetical protein